MARPLRIEFPGAVYHVTSRGNERRSIFRCDRDRKAFLGFLASAIGRFGWSVTAWVLMSNHFHLVIQTPEPNLSRGMQWLNGSYAAWFNARHQRSGHLFQGRFKAILIEKESYFSEVLRYVVLNPVRAGIVNSPEAYRWSSYRATVGLDSAPEWLDTTAVLTGFDDDHSVAQVRYRDFVFDRIESTDCLWDQLTNGMYLGTDQWAKQMRSLVESRPRSTDHPKVQRAVARPQMHAVITAVARAAGVCTETVRSTRGSTLRRLAAWLGWHEGLLTLRSIAASLRLRSEGYISGLIRRCDQEFGSNRALLAHLDLALADLRA
jgi:REP element-mobilizing transposase RayT